MTKIQKNTADMKDNSKKSFLLFKDYGDTFDALTDDLAGRLIKHIFEYQNGEEHDLDNPLLMMAFLPIKRQFFRDDTKWEDIREKRSNAGKIGGERRAQNLKQNKQMLTSISKSKHSLANQAVTVTVTDTVINKGSYNIHNTYLKDIKEKKDTYYAAWLDGIYGMYKLRSGSIGKLLEQFGKHLKAIEKIHADISGFKRHFNAWLGTQDQKQMLNEYKTRKVGAL